MKKQIVSLVVVGLIAIGAMNSGCSKDSSTNADTGLSNVNMNISFSRSATSGLGKTYGTDALDSIRIDSAVVVLARIKFESHLDSARYAPMEDMMHGDGDMDYSFKGPFVIHVRDTIGINFANANLPAGTYDGIKFKIHRLVSGEQREDSDIRNHHRWFWTNDSSIAGSSITVWGAVMKSGVWTPFKYDFNGEVEFKVKGPFVVPESGSPVNIALNFNISAFFLNTKTGALLDPTDMSNLNRNLIRQAVYAAMGAGRCGSDRGDGRPHW